MGSSDEISEREFEALEKAYIPKDPGMLDEEDWNEIKNWKLDSLRRRQKAYWEFKRNMDMRWREGQDGRILDFLKQDYEAKTLKWFKSSTHKMMKKKKMRRLIKEVYLVRHDSYCYHVDVVGVLRGSGRKIRLMTRRVIE
jgi:hypothetical protein